MAIQTSESLEHSQDQSQLRFLVAVINECKESERAYLSLSEAVSRPQNLQMFYDHRVANHPRSVWLPFGQLQVMFRSLEDLLELDDSTTKEYEAHFKAGRHILMANVYGDRDAETAASILGKAQPHAGRILGYGQPFKPLPFTA
jgi:hypothetical protein